MSDCKFQWNEAGWLMCDHIKNERSECDDPDNCQYKRKK